METETIKLIIADDHPVVRHGIRMIVEAEKDLTVLSEAADGIAALEQILEFKPDIALLDLDMPKMNGLAVLQTVRQRELPCAVIFLTIHADEPLFKDAVRLGARGYVVKDSAGEDIVKAIRVVSQGQRYVSPAVTGYLFDHPPATALRGLESLSTAEKRVLRLIADYQTNKQIAETLNLSYLTVKSHRRNIAVKLGIEGSHALMKFALDNKQKLAGNF